jgi:hypothetical protein
MRRVDNIFFLFSLGIDRTWQCSLPVTSISIRSNSCHCRQLPGDLALLKNLMKKVLIVFDGEHFPSAVLDFALQLNRKEQIMLAGVFLPSVDYAEVLTYYYYGQAVAPMYLEEYEEDPVAIKKNITRFEDFCIKHGIRYRIHQNIKRKIVEELSYETRFADLMILSNSDFYENLGERLQREYLEDTLHKAECPIMLLPESYVPTASVVLAYDGSESAMHAIKQLSYLMPHLKDTEILLMYAGIGKDEIPFHNLVKEYVTAHFHKWSEYKLEADPKRYFNTWIANKGPVLLVSGSFGRSGISELFKRNFLQEVIREHKVPMFIAHP